MAEAFHVYNWEDNVSRPLVRKDRSFWKAKGAHAQDYVDNEDSDDPSSPTSSDDSPVMSYKYEKYKRFSPYVPVNKGDSKRRRFSLSTFAKLFFLSAAMIMFCCLMYIPVYNRASDDIPKGIVAGWSIHTNRDTKVYVQPNNVTTIHEPKDVCPRTGENSLFLLIVICSSTINFDQREAIRKSWANYENYVKMSKIFNLFQAKYKKYNYTYDLYPLPYVNALNKNVSKVNRSKRSISFGSILPELAAALKDNLKNNLRKDQLDDEDMLAEFDMNKELGDPTDANEPSEYYDYDSNVMKIPPNGYEESPNLDQILSELKLRNTFTETSISNNDNIIRDKDIDISIQGDRIFRVVFLLGMPSKDNDSQIQSRIEEEVEMYGDIIQEDFVDSYNNLTLKSIMMLKWVVNHCSDSVRYILKTDDDMFINIPNLVATLKNKSKEFDNRPNKREKDREYLLIGDLIYGAKPVSDSQNKWYSPRYMYSGRVYPKYLSGTGYTLSVATAQSLYEASLRTPFFHLEDIFITGLSAARAHPRQKARDDPGFTYQMTPLVEPCAVYSHVTSHRVPHHAMTSLAHDLLLNSTVDVCERLRLTKIRRDRMRPKTLKTAINKKYQNSLNIKKIVSRF